MQPLGPMQTMSSSRNFVRPQPRHPLNRPGTLWLDDNAKENNSYSPGIQSNQPRIGPRSSLSSENHHGIMFQPEDHSYRPPRAALGNVTNSRATANVPATLGHSTRKYRTDKAAGKPGIPRSRGELSELAEFLKSTGPEDFTRRNSRPDIPGGSIVFVDVPMNEGKPPSKALVDSVNKESLANRKMNTGRWLKKAVGMLWGAPNKGEFKEEPAAKEDIKPPAAISVPKAPSPPLQNTFVGKTPLAVFGRNAAARPLNSPDINPPVSESPLFFNDAPRLPPLADVILSPGGTRRPVAISSLADLKDTLLCMSAEAAARSHSLPRSNSEESFSDVLPAVDATGILGFGNRRPTEDGGGSEVDSMSVYSTDSGVVLAKEGEAEKRVSDGLVFDKDYMPTGLLLNLETPAASSFVETLGEAPTPEPAVEQSQDSTSTSTCTPDIQLSEENYQDSPGLQDDVANNSDDDVEEFPSYPPPQRKRARTSIVSICQETGKQYFFVEFMGFFFPMPPTYASPKIEYEETTGPEGDISRLARELTRRENEKRFATLFEEADEVLREIRIEDAEDVFGEYFTAKLDSSRTTTSGVSSTNPIGLSRSSNSSSTLATPGVLSIYTTSMSSDGLLPDETDPGSACWSSPLGGVTQIRIVPATPSPRLGGLGGGILRKPKAPLRFRSLSTALEREAGLTDVRRTGLRIGSV